MCACSISLLLLSDLVFGDLGSDLRTLDPQIDCCFSCYIYCLALRVWMRVRIGWFATSQLRQQPCVRHSFSPRITALNLMRSHQYLPLLLCVSVEYSGTSFSLWNCVPRFAESLPVSVVFRITCWIGGYWILSLCFSVSLCVEYSGRTFCPLELYFSIWRVSIRVWWFLELFLGLRAESGVNWILGDGNQVQKSIKAAKDWFWTPSKKEQEELERRLPVKQTGISDQK